MSSERVKSSFVAENLLIDTPHSQSGIVKMETILDETKALADKLGSRLGIVVFPSALQINQDHFPFFQTAGFQTHDETLTENSIQDHLSRLATERNIPTLDLLPHYRADRDASYYLDYNIHFNMNGNRIAADAIDEFASALAN